MSPLEAEVTEASYYEDIIRDRMADSNGVRRAVDPPAGVKVYQPPTAARMAARQPVEGRAPAVGGTVTRR